MENEDTNTKKIHIATRCDSVKNMSERNVAHNKRSDIIKWRVVNERVGVERQIADWPIDAAFFRLCYEYCAEKSQKVVTNHLENCLKFLTIKHFYGFALIVCRNVDALDLISITLKNAHTKMSSFANRGKLSLFLTLASTPFVLIVPEWYIKFSLIFFFFSYSYKSSISDGGCDSKHQNNFMPQQNVGSVINDDRSE